MNTLRKTVNEKDEESRKRQSMLDAKVQELEQMKSISGTGDVAQSLEHQNSNPKTLGSTPWRGWVRDNFSVPPSQLLCRLVSA